MKPAVTTAWRSLLALCAWGLLVSSLLPLLIFGLTPYATVQALGRIVYAEGDCQRLVLALTPDRYAGLLVALAGVALVAGGALLALGRGGRYAGQQPLSQSFGAEIRQVGTDWRHTWRTLTAYERCVGVGLLLALLAVRFWWLAASPLSTDEVASYDYFIREGPVASAAFYPFPNNHLLFSLLAWAASGFTSQPLLVLRLPTLLAVTVGTGAAYLLLTRHVGFEAATLSTGLFGLSPLGITYAVAGRGYGVQLLLLGAAFFAALALLQGTRQPRLAWAVFLGASVAALYTVLSAAYAVLALGLGLLLGFGGARRWPDVGRLLVVAATIAAATVLLYAPVVAVSGLARLVGNRYVAPRPAAIFWRQYAGHLHVQADALAGHAGWGIGLVVGLGLLVPVVWRRRPAQRPLLGLLGLLVVVPVALMAGQRVLAPARALLLLGAVGSVGAGVVGAAGLGRLGWLGWLGWLGAPGRGRLAGALLLIGAYGSYQVAHEARSIQFERRQARLTYAAYHWLKARGAQRVWLASARHRLFWHHYALLENRRSLLQPSLPGLRYQYAVLPAAAVPAWARPARFAVVYRNAFVVIYAPPR